MMVIVEYNFFFFCNTGLLLKRLEFLFGEGYISLNWGSKLAYPIIKLIASVDL